MNTPEITAARFAAACLMGLPLGLLYAALRPLRPRLTALADGCFVAAVAGVWVVFSFAVCQGDLRFGYWPGLFLGAAAAERTLGRLLQPLFTRVWWVLGKVLSCPFRILKKIFLKCAKFFKILFASGKKSGTIGENSKFRQNPFSGGESHA